MENLTAIIPSRNEKYLNQTILDIQKKSRAEIIVVLDGEDAERLDGVKYIHNKDSRGMRTAINQAVALADTKYIVKCDAHCMFDENFDEKLIAEHRPNWIQTPRRKRLDPEKWELIMGSPDVDYMFIRDLKGYKDHAKNTDPELKKVLIDDIEIFQGSCYFMEKDYFNKLGLLDDVNFGKMGSEALEIVLKCRHNKGRVVVNKKTWYAHAYTERLYAGGTQERAKSHDFMKTLIKQLQI